MDRTKSQEAVIDRCAGAGIRIAMPERSQRYPQDTEWCVVHLDGQWREIRFHDYAQIYAVEGLYERLFYDILECRSPDVLAAAFARQLERAGTAPDELRVLDLGAGNGIMAEQLAGLGVDSVVGVDILPEAARAAQRDRPEVYAEYHVLDLADLPLAGHESPGHESPGHESPGHELLCRGRLNTLTCVAALGFGDIPPRCFTTAFNLVTDGGWVVFTIKDDFLSDADTTGFAGLISDAVEDGMLELLWTERYQHRLATDRTPLCYTGVVGRKRGDLHG
ncbi:MAG: class I SAM-dependent DNA methyltransferase [Pseudonocardiaceae bacterium]